MTKEQLKRAVELKRYNKYPEHPYVPDRLKD